MAGGIGERFWPRTSEETPKYALRLERGETFLARTFLRLRPVFGRDRIHVVTTGPQVKLARRLIPQLPRSRILAEPCRRNTAGAVTLAHVLLKRRYGAEAVISFFPADHLIQKQEIFHRLVRTALRLAYESDRLVLFGIRPTGPATGFGYIERGEPLRFGHGASRVKRFVEKPHEKSAERFLSSGRFLWNSGIFTWKMRVFEEEMRRHAGSYLKRFETVMGRHGLKRAKLREVYRLIRSLPIDKLLMEKSDRLVVFPCDLGWDDLGSWDALRRAGSGRDGNVIPKRAVRDDVTGSYVSLEPGSRIVMAGVHDLVLVQAGKDFLICHRKRSQDVAKLRALLAIRRAGT